MILDSVISEIKKIRQLIYYEDQIKCQLDFLNKMKFSTFLSTLKSNDFKTS